MSRFSKVEAIPSAIALNVGPNVVTRSLVSRVFLRILINDNRGSALEAIEEMETRTVIIVNGDKNGTATSDFAMC